MILTVTKTVTEQIEVEGEFPLFRQHGMAYYKILSETDYIEVYTPCDLWFPQVSKNDVKHTAGKVIKEGEVITESEFTDAYVKTIYAIQVAVYPEQQLTTAEQDIAA